MAKRILASGLAARAHRKTATDLPEVAYALPLHRPWSPHRIGALAEPEGQVVTPNLPRNSGLGHDGMPAARCRGAAHATHLGWMPPLVGPLR